MAKLDLEWLDVFVELYRTQSVSRAAERLDMRPGVGQRRAAQAARHFGDELFIRTSRGMEPTPHAQALYPSCWRCVDRIERVRGTRSALRSGRRPQRTFRICMTDISEIVLLPRCSISLRQVAPAVVRRGGEDVGRQPAPAREQAIVDLAVGFMPQLDAGFYQQALF